MVEPFITKDSGKREEFDSGMVRDTTEGKVRFDLAFDGPIAGFDLLRNFLDPKSADFELVATFETWFIVGGLDQAFAVIKLIAQREGIFPFFKRCAELMTRGAVKYQARNWMQAKGTAEYDRFKDSARRHFLQYMAGERDEDHAAAVWFNINGAEYVSDKLQLHNITASFVGFQNENFPHE